MNYTEEEMNYLRKIHDLSCALTDITLDAWRPDFTGNRDERLKQFNEKLKELNDFVHEHSRAEEALKFKEETKKTDMKCPLCKNQYGVDSDLEEIITKNNIKLFKCTNKSLRHEFCEHVLNATKNEINQFSCENCSSPIDDCDCLDCCEVFCERCGVFVHLSCSDVTQMMEINEQKRDKNAK